MSTLTPKSFGQLNFGQKCFGQFFRNFGQIRYKKIGKIVFDRNIFGHVKRAKNNQKRAILGTFCVKLQIFSALRAKKLKWGVVIKDKCFFLLENSVKLLPYN